MRSSFSIAVPLFALAFFVTAAPSSVAGAPSYPSLPSLPGCTQLVSDVPQGFGAPANFFSDRELLLTADCNTDSFQPAVVSARGFAGAELPLAVYRVGYVWNGQRWSSFNYGSMQDSSRARDSGGLWINGSAVGPRLEYNGPAPESTYFLGYACQWFDSKWKCGCEDRGCTSPGWQLQEVVQPAVDR